MRVEFLCHDLNLSMRLKRKFGTDSSAKDGERESHRGILILAGRKVKLHLIEVAKTK